MGLLSEEQEMLRDAAKGWARQNSPVAAFRAMRDSDVAIAYDADSWKAIADMGWAGVIVPEKYGGSDFGYLSLGLVLEELGRTLTASPLAASAMGTASALVLGGTESQKALWLPRIAEGSAIGTLAIDEGTHHAPERVAAKATKSDTGYVLNGAKVFVLEGLAAHLLIVSARTAGEPGDQDGITLFAVPADAPGIGRERLALIDHRGAARITFSDVEVGAESVIGTENSGWSLLDKILDRARAGLSAEMLGAALEAFEITVEYLKVRVQFGQPIGSFQALQHRAAGMFTDLELARSTVEAALRAIDEGSPDVAELVSLAKIKVGDTFYRVSNEMIQMHGGIGMTDEHDAGFYLKRARTCEAAFGNRSYHRERFATIRGF
jgi:Acyl-CoA dehydrogenases